MGATPFLSVSAKAAALLLAVACRPAQPERTVIRLGLRPIDRLQSRPYFMHNGGPMAESPTQPTCPIPRNAVIDRYFMEHRATLIDLAAFLDRIDRSEAPANSDEDFRLEALRRAITLLTDDEPQRARRILELFSDTSAEPIAKAPMKGAKGAVDPA